MPSKLFHDLHWVLEIGDLTPKHKDTLKKKIDGFGGQIDYGISKSTVSTMKSR